MPVQSHHGFTVVEALVAIAIASGGVVALAALAQQVTDGVAHSRRTLSAAVLADRGVATLIGRSMTATADGCLDTDTAGCMETLAADGQPSTTAVAFVRRWRVVLVATSPLLLRSVTVCVVQAGARGRRAPTAGGCANRLVGGLARW